MVAGRAPEKVAMYLSVRCVVTADHIALRVDAIALRGIRSRNGNVDTDEGAVALNEAVLISGLIVIEANHVTFGIYARDPSESRVGKINGTEISVGERKAVGLTIAVEVGPHNSCGVDNHGGESAHRAREIDQRKSIFAEKVSMAVRKISIDKLHAYDISGVADAKAGEIDRGGTGKIDGLKGAFA